MDYDKFLDIQKARRSAKHMADMAAMQAMLQESLQIAGTLGSTVEDDKSASQVQSDEIDDYVAGVMMDEEKTKELKYKAAYGSRMSAEEMGIYEQIRVHEAEKNRRVEEHHKAQRDKLIQDVIDCMEPSTLVDLVEFSKYKTIDIMTMVIKRSVIEALKRVSEPVIHAEGRGSTYIA